MSNPSAAPSPQTVQIPERAHAVGPGWRQLLDHLHHQIHAIAPGYRLVDLTEKLGGLRLHVENPGGTTDTLHSLIDSARTESVRTCEFCGAPGRIRTRNDRLGGWRKTVCDTCHSAWSAHRLMIVHGVVRARDR
ncbi:hypothetical protein GCM10022403_034360 [Streptomyces coacervatus]|uniref:Uncharacterized protein n=1 Tax=Streptomyces coacervatus TaxID=647381 RepID=A0ABP7HMQ4_9ACTN|nr:hypothetical protein [Streptomyces coacervatus]MDF2272089.1 hypothetical protein [Streptomyces coacervatus]